MASAPDDPSTTPTQHPSNPTKPFRFKRPRSPSPSPSEPPQKRRSPSPTSSAPQNSRHARRHHHRHHHRSKRRPHTPPDDHNDPHSNWDKESFNVNPDIAFRESLFDALADDEGAAFWEGVYGQPIHTYSPYYPAPKSHDDTPGDPAKPSLEKMDDEQYVAYVRRKMWEKSHGHVLEERRRKKEAQMREKAKKEESRRWQAGVEEALRRGEERRKRQGFKIAWERYLAGWELQKDKVPWPVESGKIKDVGADEVENFFKSAADLRGVDLGYVLKKERVRWHPDKMQQRAGEGGIDRATMKLVTAVFQVVDRLWNEIRR